MSGLTFIVAGNADLGYVASAINESIVTDGEDVESLAERVREAVVCHFDEGSGPAFVTLRFVHEVTIQI